MVNGVRRRVVREETGNMSERERELLHDRLLAEIARIESRVAGLGAPATMEQRALFARYGKLLLLSQRLLEVLPELWEREPERLPSHPALAVHHSSMVDARSRARGRRAFRRDGRL